MGRPLVFFTACCATTFAITYRPNIPLGDAFARLFTLGVTFSFLGPLLLGAFSLVSIPAALFLTTMICSIRQLSRKAGSLWIGAASLAVVAGFACWWASIEWQLNHLLENHPVTSLADRLEYERDFRTTTEINRNRWFETYGNSNDTIRSFDQLLDDEYMRIDGNTRVRSFDSLLSAHRSINLQFQLAAGFGFLRTRTLPYRYWRIDVPKRSLLPQPKICDPYSSSEFEETTAGVDYAPWHRQNLVDFAHPATLGFVDWDGNNRRPDLTRVVGFQPHAFGSNPKPPTTSGDEHGSWQIVSLSLMSLLKQRPAAVYVSENLPNMDELANVPTRPLDDFEAVALGKLQNGEELVVKGNSAHIRMLGSIRAAVQCQQCHQVERGTLLGAFSYRLNRQITNENEN